MSRGPLTLTLQLMGDVERAHMLTRGGGHVGDDIYVTGTLGDSAAGIALITERTAAPPGSAAAALKERFYRPVPRVGAGLALGPLATAAIDVSDGLLADLGHLCNASGCGAAIDVERVPLSAELLSLFPPQEALAHALGGGDDYELCFTAPPSRAEEIESALEAAGTPVRAHRPARRRTNRRVPARRRAVHSGRARLSPFLSASSDLWARCAIRFISSRSVSAPGLAPYAPGTFGSARRRASRPGGCSSCRSSGASGRRGRDRLGVWVCGESARRLSVHDDQRIVFDEIAGVLADELGRRRKDVFRARVSLCLF